MLACEVADESILEARYSHLIGTNYSWDLWSLLTSDYKAKIKYQAVSDAATTQIAAMCSVGIKNPGWTVGLRKRHIDSFPGPD